MSGHGDIPNPESWLQGPFLTGALDVVTTKIDLSWTAPQAAYAGKPTYTIFRNDNGGAFSALVTLLPLTQLAYVDTTAVATHTYVYYVVVAYLNGAQLPSNRVSLVR